jgi:hypothetical protein
MNFPPLRHPPAGMNPVWWPINAQQQLALEIKAQFLLYGGQSGGGKTDFLVSDAMQEQDNPNLRGLLLRKSFGEMNQLMDRMSAIYRPLGAVWKDRSHEWIFPSGAKIRTGYMASDADVGNYQGNPFSWLGVDEAGAQREKRIRSIIPWLASTDSRLRVRARFTANPGGEGHSWLMKVFLRGKCPIHFPGNFDESNRSSTSVWPGRVYEGSRWASDDDLLNKTVAFIPASVRDNPLYGQDKIDSLMSQTAEIREALLHGCWCQAEGMYFPFLRTNQIVPYATLDDMWWWVHFLSIDYGYGNSAAAAGLYNVNEAGKVHKIAERVRSKMSSDDFAAMLCEDWIRPAMTFPGETAKPYATPHDLKRLEMWTAAQAERNRHPVNERRRIVCVYMDSANDQHHGTGQSNMEIMADVFQKQGVSVVPVDDKSRLANAQQVHREMSSGRFALCDTAPKSYESLASRTYDDNHTKGVKKIHGDPLDDVYDETSYGINTWRRNTIKPGDIAINDRLAKMAEAGVNDRSLLIQRARLEKQRKPEVQNIGMGRRRGAPVVRR